MPAWFPAEESAVAALREIPAPAACVAARASANLTLAHFPGADPDVDRDQTRQPGSGFYDVRLTAAVAPAFRLGDHLPEAALRPLAEARDRASEISAGPAGAGRAHDLHGTTSRTFTMRNGVDYALVPLELRSYGPAAVSRQQLDADLMAISGYPCGLIPAQAPAQPRPSCHYPRRQRGSAAP
ncbi:hypothetical protein IL992_44225 [Microbispora sp. NEAU-D428]|uniref:hypothetical protein n=1 Tax=Microbispora sitophila TaxID=2771537 RepID=UPI0018685C06|nr:hypothetical protein [Microbispora sitophila]MBE3016109.1 hypothetical protein [Microbispora sitophila]